MFAAALRRSASFTVRQTRTRASATNQDPVKAAFLAKLKEYQKAKNKDADIKRAMELMKKKLAGQ